MYVDTIQLREILEDKFDVDQSKVIAKAIDKAFEDGINAQSKILATKEDISIVKAELKEKATKGDLANLKAELFEKIVTQKVELIEKITDNKAEIIKWMFIFYISQTAILGGLIFTMLKLYF